jgi:hypothetical protein
VQRNGTIPQNGGTAEAKASGFTDSPSASAFFKEANIKTFAQNPEFQAFSP